MVHLVLYDANVGAHDVGGVGVQVPGKEAGREEFTQCCL